MFHFLDNIVVSVEDFLHEYWVQIINCFVDLW